MATTGSARETIEIHRLHLSDVTPDPGLAWSRPTFSVYAYLVLDAGGPILIDTGVGVGNELIDALYRPVHHDLDDALSVHGITVEDVATVITSHLHFDHCGQNHRFEHAQVLVQEAEVEAARVPQYTVEAWAFPPGIELTSIDGDHQVSPAVRIVATPGHTPGHQSVVVEGGEGLRTVVCCQAAWDASAFGAGVLGDPGWNEDAGEHSLARLRALEPDSVLMSHDSTPWRRRDRASDALPGEVP